MNFDDDLEQVQAAFQNARELTAEDSIDFVLVTAAVEKKFFEYVDSQQRDDSAPRSRVEAFATMKECVERARKLVRNGEAGCLLVPDGLKTRPVLVSS